MDSVQLTLWKFTLVSILYSAVFDFPSSSLAYLNTKFRSWFLFISIIGEARLETGLICVCESGGGYMGSKVHCSDANNDNNQFKGGTVTTILLLSRQNCGEIMTQNLCSKQETLLQSQEEEILQGRANQCFLFVCFFLEILPTHNDKT